MSLKPLVFLIVSVVLSACASNSEQKLSYRSSEITPTLEIPPDLTRLNADDNLDLPGSSVGRPENTGRYVETGSLNVEVRTLPRIEGLRIDGQGDMHWLVVPQTAERLYPLMRTFWAEQGFRLAKDEPAVGIMQTEWLNLRSGSDSFWGSLLSSLAAAESRDQYRTRLERAADGAETHVYLAHRGQELVIDDADDTTRFSAGRQGWQMVDADPAKEYEMLSRMMLFLGLQQEQVQIEMQKIGLFASRARIQHDEEDDKTFLLVSQGFQQTWNRLIHQLDRRSIEKVSTTREDNSGSIGVNAADLMAGSQDSAANDIVLVTLVGSRNANQTQLDIRDQQGLLVQTDASRAVLQELFRLLK